MKEKIKSVSVILALFIVILLFMSIAVIFFSNVAMVVFDIKQTPEVIDMTRNVIFPSVSIMGALLVTWWKLNQEEK